MRLKSSLITHSTFHCITFFSFISIDNILRMSNHHSFAILIMKFSNYWGKRLYFQDIQSNLVLLAMYYVYIVGIMILLVLLVMVIMLRFNFHILRNWFKFTTNNSIWTTFIVSIYMIWDFIYWLELNMMICISLGHTLALTHFSWKFSGVEDDFHSHFLTCV